MSLFTLPMGLRDDQARERIRDWFTKSGMTQKRFAEKVGWTQPTMNSFLKGHHNTDLDTLAAMARVFGRTLADVIASGPTEPDPLMSLFHAVEDDVQKAVVVLLEGAKRSARPPGQAHRSVRGPRRE